MRKVPQPATGMSLDNGRPERGRRWQLALSVRQMLELPILGRRSQLLVNTSTLPYNHPDSYTSLASGCPSPMSGKMKDAKVIVLAINICTCRYEDAPNTMLNKLTSMWLTFLRTSHDYFRSRRRQPR